MNWYKNAKWGDYWPTPLMYKVRLIRVLPDGIISEIELEIQAASLREAELIAIQQLGTSWSPESEWGC